MLARSRSWIRIRATIQSPDGHLAGRRGQSQVEEKFDSCELSFHVTADDGRLKLTTIALGLGHSPLNVSEGWKLSFRMQPECVELADCITGG